MNNNSTNTAESNRITKLIHYFTRYSELQWHEIKTNITCNLQNSSKGVLNEKILRHKKIPWVTIQKLLTNIFSNFLSNSLARNVLSPRISSSRASLRGSSTSVEADFGPCGPLGGFFVSFGGFVLLFFVPNLSNWKQKKCVYAKPKTTQNPSKFDNPLLW